MSTSINNKTTIDSSARRLGLYRELNEGIEEFRLRVEKAIEKEFEYNKYSFRDSLDYITKERFKNLFILEPPGDVIEISFDGVGLKIGSESFFLHEFKFVKDFKLFLESKSFSIGNYSTDFDYLKTSNIVPFSSERQKLNFVTERSEQVFLNEKNILNVYDSLGTFNDDDNGSQQFDASNHKEEWHVVRDGYLLKESPNEDTISYQYSDYPLTIQWSQFRYYSPNDSSFDYRIKKRVKVLKDDTEETPYILTQEGAKLINKLYKISNTYWGE